MLKAIAGGSVLLMVLLLALAYTDLREHRRYERQMDDAQQVRSLFALIRSNVHEAEAACLGHVAGGDARSLDAFSKARTGTDSALTKLADLLPDTMATSAKVGLRLAADNCFRAMSNLIMTRRLSGLMPDTVALTGMQHHRDGLMQLVDGVERRHANTLYSKDGDRAKGAFETPLPIILYALIALAGIAILFFRLLRGLDRLQAAELFAREALVTRDREAMIRDRAERNLKRIVNSSPSGIMAFRSERDAVGRIVDLRLAMVNAVGAAMVGRKPEEITGTLFSENIPGMATDAILGQLIQVVESGEPLRTEHHVVTRDRDMWFDVGAVRLLDGVVMTFTNVTDRRNEQQLLQESQRLAVTGRFARMIAHEIRNPLTNIHLALDQLEHDPPPSPAQAPFIAIMKRNATRIGDLITRMLHSSRPMDVTLVPGPINSVLLEVHEIIKDRCALKEITVGLDLSKDLPPIDMDHETLVVAFVNLCVNAIEAMEQGAGRLTIASAGIDGRVVVSIADNGRGLTETEREQIFQPFFSGRKGGMGLGLTEARNILNAHNALLTLDSVVGHGTTFTLSFPAGPKAVA